MNRVLILGAGTFGARAAEALRERCRQITVVDKNRSVLDKLQGKGYHLVCADAVAALQSQTPPEHYDYVVPAVPVHVAFDWLMTRLTATGRACRKLAVPPHLPVPNPFCLQGTLYSSLAEHLCPVDCPEPEGECFVTGEERAMPLYERLAALDVPGYIVAVVQSRQLAPGVGGLRSDDLEQLYRSTVDAKANVIVATACACHAVLDAFVLQ